MGQDSGIQQVGPLGHFKGVRHLIRSLRRLRLLLTVCLFAIAVVRINGQYSGSAVVVLVPAVSSRLRSELQDDNKTLR